MDPFNARGNEGSGFQENGRQSIDLEAGDGPIAHDLHLPSKSEQDNEEYKDSEGVSETGLSEQQNEQENSLISNQASGRIPLEAEADSSCKRQEEVPELNKMIPDDNKDTEYGGVNFSNLLREMTTNKMWHERTWAEILKHFSITLIIGVLPTFFDVGTDVYAAIEHHNEDDLAWSLTTLILIFFPGVFFSFWVAQAYSEKHTAIRRENCCIRFAYDCCAFFILFLLFPFILIGVKIVGLFNPGPEWKRLTVKVTAFEGDFEASLQLLLSLYIIFRADRTPEWWQVAQLVASMVMITKTAIADFLLPRQPMSFFAELKATIYLIPLFLTNCAFKVLSLAIIAADMKEYYILIVFPCVMTLLHLPDLPLFSREPAKRICGYPRENKKFLTMGSPKHMIRLLVIKQGNRITKNSMINFLYNNKFWFVVHSSLLLITSLFITLHDQMCAVIFSALILNIILIYFQLWRPYKAEHGENIVEAGVNGTEEAQVEGRARGVDEEGIEEEGSKQTCYCCAVIYVLCCIVAIPWIWVSCMTASMMC